MSSTALVPAGSGGLSLGGEALERVRALRLALNEFGPEQAQAAAIYAAALGAAANTKRAWDVAREAFELQIRAERKLGQLWLAYQADCPPHVMAGRIMSGEKPKWPVLLEPKRQGAIMKLGDMPADVFEDTLSHLLGNHKSVDVFTVLRIAHLRSLSSVEEGIQRAWDGAFFIPNEKGTYRRAKGSTLDAVRAELHEQLRLRKRPPRDPVTRRLDDAFAEARKDAQALSKLRDEIAGEAGRIIADAELLQARVAELLFKAYKTVSSSAGGSAHA